MMKARTAGVIVVALGAAAAFVYVVSKRADNASGSADATAGSAVNVPAPEPAMTTEQAPLEREVGFQPPPSDVAGVSKPEAESKR